MKYKIEIGTGNLKSGWQTDDMKMVLDCWGKGGIITVNLPNGETASYNLAKYNYLIIKETKEK